MDEEHPLLPVGTQRKEPTVCLVSRRRIAVLTLLSGVAMLGMFSLGRESATSSPSSFSSSSFALHAVRRGGYAVMAQHTLDAYDLEMILEPDVEVILKVDENDASTDDSNTYLWTVTPFENDRGKTGSFSFVDTASETLTGSELHMTFTPANSLFKITCTSR